jgi:hypothetical protein
VQADRFDQGHDLRLGSAQPQRATAHPQAPGQHGEIEHQRGIGEHELAQIDDDVGLRLDRTDQRATADALGGAILVAATAERRYLFIEIDDGGKLHKRTP